MIEKNLIDTTREIRIEGKTCKYGQPGIYFFL